MYPRETLADLNREVEMMSNPDRWPQWPYLPLKKPGNVEEMAYLANFDLSESPTIVCRKGNIFTANTDDEAIPFESFTDLLNAGWRVD